MTKNQAIRFYGTASALARAAKVTRQAVNQWVDIPPKQQIKLERITIGVLTADADCWEKILGPAPKKGFKYERRHARTNGSSKAR